MNSEFDLDYSLRKDLIINFSCNYLILKIQKKKVPTYIPKVHFAKLC